MFVPQESRRNRPVVRKEAGEGTVPLDPAVKRYNVTLTAPTLHDPLADTERLLAALEREHGLAGVTLDYEMLQTLPGIARGAKWDLDVVVWRPGEAGGMVVDARAAGAGGRLLGLAVDVGTTTIAAYLTDLLSGEVLATESAMNPQVAFGDDVIARLHHVIHNEGGLDELQRVVVTEINSLAERAATA